MRPLEYEFLESARAFGIELTPGFMDSFRTFSGELIKWNRKINLTAAKGIDQILLHHILDSLVPVPHLVDARRIADVGSGAGFPGVPMKIVMRETHMVLIESIRKKASFLDHVVTLLGLKGIEVIWNRVEGDQVQRRFETEPLDALISRAALPARLILEAGGRILKRDGRVVLMKGALSEADIVTLEAACRPDNWKIIRDFRYRLPQTRQDRSLVILQRGFGFT